MNVINGKIIASEKSLKPTVPTRSCDGYVYEYDCHYKPQKIFALDGIHDFVKIENEISALLDHGKRFGL